MSTDGAPPSHPPDPTGTLQKNSDFFAIAKIYGGLAYLGSLPGSPAARAQLRRGDVVLSVNGLPTPDLTSFLHARGQREGGATVRFVRNGVEHEVELVWDTLLQPTAPLDVDTH